MAIECKSFSMIHVIPDQVLMWIGGAPLQLGESEIGDRGEALAGSAGTRVSNLAQSTKASAGQKKAYNKVVDDKRAARNPPPPQE